MSVARKPSFVYNSIMSLIYIKKKSKAMYILVESSKKRDAK